MAQEIRYCVTQDGVRLAYAKVGQGLPLVKIGTWLTHLGHDLDNPVWRPWLENLSRYHSLYRYDPRGCGLSDWAVDRFTLEDLVSDLETVVDAAGLEQFALMGISQGGWIAITYALRHPERVSHLIIYGGYLRGMARRNNTELEAEETEVYLRLLKLAWASENPTYKQLLSTELLPEGTPEQLGWINHLQHISTSAENVVKLQQVYNQIYIPELATNVRTPTLVLHPKHDAAVPFEEGRIIAVHMAEARFVPLDSKNHIILTTEPAWNQLWREFYHFFGFELPADQPEPPQPIANVPLAIADLTLRERQILHLLAQGYRNDEIAQTLVITPKTVRNYISRIYEKLDVTSRGQAIVLAREAGFDTHQ
ncbi:MAG: alpha/beta fold hydrolase [Anaerolineae bacterium]|nr:alpha/beta fold hydrolase [Anaerolineae bacterium]